MNSLEIEIHNLFQENASIDHVCHGLLSKYEKNETLSSEEVAGISHFLIKAGKLDALKKFYIKCLKFKKIGQLPLGYIVEALALNQIPIDDAACAFFDYIISVQPDETTSLQSNILHLYSTKITSNRENLKSSFIHQRNDTKAKLIEQLNKNRLYQLHDQEQAVLDQLNQLFPNDIEAGILKQAQLERKADEILSRLKAKKGISKPKSITSEFEHDSATQQTVAELENNIRTLAEKFATEAPEQLYNLSILAYQFDFFELTLEIIEKTPQTRARDWLKAEVLHDCGRFLDLLKLIEQLESSSEASPEDAHGAIYLKALAYYGLGQKDIAVRLLQSLSRSIPFYRSTEALLHEWEQT